MSEEDDDEYETACSSGSSAGDEHLEDLPDGSGCVEVWEHLADRRGDDE